MRLITLALLVACLVSLTTQQNQLLTNSYVCNVNRDITYEYRKAIYDFCIDLYKSLAIRSNFNFVFSPTSVWIMLAALAEGADPQTQQQFFRLLNLPNDQCIRQAYYQIATTRAFPTNEVNILSTRILLLDSGATLSPSWYDFVLKNNLLQVVTAPIRYSPVATANEIKRIMSSQLPRLDLSGNSVLLDTMDYNGLWTTAFADAVIERTPFYNRQGEQIGAVDMMRVKRRARMAYVKALNTKFIELSIGSDERYRMIFAVVIGSSDVVSAVASVNSDLVFELVASLKDSYVPVDVAIPRVLIGSEIDVKTILQDVGVRSVWTDPVVTRYISNPPALPSSFVQRSTVVLNNTGLYSPPLEFDSPDATSTGLDPILGRDFIADRPFLFGLFDAETYTCLTAAAYTKPTYT